MSIVTFYRGDPNAPKTTMPAHLGANAIITCGGKLLLEKRRDSDTWGLVGGGVKKYETEAQRLPEKCGKSWACVFQKKNSTSWRYTENRDASPPIGTAASGGWSLWSLPWNWKPSRI